MKALEISHFRRIAGFDQSLETAPDQLDEASAEHRLLAEQICLAFLFEIRFDDSRPAAANRGAVRQRSFQGAAGRVVVDGDKTGNAAAFCELAPHRVAGPFGSHHDNVDALLRSDQVEMNVQAVGKSDGRSFPNVVVDVVPVRLRLKFIGHGKHDEVAPCGGLGDAHDLQSFGFRFLGGRRAGAQGHDDAASARIAQVQRVGMALRPISQNRDVFFLDEIYVAISVVIYAHSILRSSMAEFGHANVGIAAVFTP